MTNFDRDIQRKLRAPRHAEQIGDVSKACRYFGISRAGIVTLALVSHFWPLPEPAESLEMLQRHQAKRSEFGGELCQRDNASGTPSNGRTGRHCWARPSRRPMPGRFVAAT